MKAGPGQAVQPGGYIGAVQALLRWGTAGLLQGSGRHGNTFADGFA